MLNASLLQIGKPRNYESVEEPIVFFFNIIVNNLGVRATGATVV